MRTHHLVLLAAAALSLLVFVALSLSTSNDGSAPTAPAPIEPEADSEREIEPPGLPPELPGTEPPPDGGKTRSVDVEVVDEAGDPVPEAIVTVSDKAHEFGRKATDANGRCRFEGLPPIGWMEVRAEGPPGTVPASSGRIPKAPKPVRLVLIRGGTVRGTVVDKNGAPLPVECTVRLEFDWSAGGGQVRRRIRRKPTGNTSIVLPAGSISFEITGVEPGSFHARATAAGYEDGLSAPFEVRKGESIEDVAILMSRGGSVSGIVVRGQTGEPIAGAEVSVIPGDNMLYRTVGMQAGRMRFAGQYMGKTDEQGRFLITGVKPGVYGVMATAKDLTPGRIGEVKVEREREAGGLHISLGEGGAITGTVYGEDGKPEPNAAVLISYVDPRIQIHGDFGRRLTADDQGVYFVDHLEPGDYRVKRPTGGDAMAISLRVSTEEGEEAPERRKDPNLVTVREGQVARHDLFNDRSSRLLVRLTDGEGKPLQRLVSLRSLSPPEGGSGPGPRVVVPAMGHTRTNGEHEFVGIAAGPYEVVAEGQRKTVDLAPGDRKTIDIRIAVGSVAGVVRDEEGRPVAGARVTLRRRQEAGVGSVGFMAPPTQNQTDDSGRFSVPGVAPGRYVAWVKVEGGSGTSEEFSVADGETRTGVVVQLETIMTVTVEFRDAEGEPLVGALVMFYSFANPESGWTRGRTNPSGVVEVKLAPGRYQVHAQVNGEPRPRSAKPNQIVVGRSSGQRFAIRVK